MKAREAQRRQQQRRNANANPPTPIPLQALPAGGNHGTSNTEESEHANDTQEGQTTESNPIKIVIEKDNRGNRQEIIANVIAGLGFAIAAFVFYYTYKLFEETKKANQTTQNAIDHQAAKDLVDAYFKYQDNKNEEARNVENKRVHDSDIKRQNELIGLQSASTQAQIDAFNNQSERFALQSNPELQANKFYIDTVTQLTKPELKFHLKTEGLKSVYITETTVRVVYSYNYLNNKTVDSILDITPTRPFNLLVGNTEQEVSILCFSSSDEIKKYMTNKEHIENETMYFLVCVEFNYYNPIKKTRYAYKFCVQTIAGRIGFALWRNINIPTKKIKNSLLPTDPVPK